MNINSLIQRMKNPTMGYAFAHQLLSAGFGMLQMLIMVRVLSQNEFGIWGVFISFLSLAEMAQHGFFQTVVIKEVATHPDSEVSAIANAAGYFSLGLSMLLMTITILLQLLFFPYDAQSAFSIFLRWYPLFSLSLIIFNVCSWVNMGKNNFKGLFTQRLVYVSVTLLYIAFRFFTAKITLWDGLCAQIAGNTAASLYLLLKKEYVPMRATAITWQLGKRFLQYGKFTVITLINGSLLRNADTFLLNAFIGPAAVAVYSIPQKINEVFEVMLRTVASTALPEWTPLKSEPHKIQRLFLKKCLFLCGIFLPICIVFAWAAPWMITVISGESSYGEAAQVLRVFMIYVLILPIDRLLGVMLEVLDRPQWNLLKTFCITLVNVGGDIWVMKYHYHLATVASVSIFALLAGIIVGYFAVNLTIKSKTTTASH